MKPTAFALVLGALAAPAFADGPAPAPEPAPALEQLMEADSGGASAYAEAADNAREERAAAEPVLAGAADERRPGPPRDVRRVVVRGDADAEAAAAAAARSEALSESSPSVVNTVVVSRGDDDERGERGHRRERRGGWGPAVGALLGAALGYGVGSSIACLCTAGLVSLVVIGALAGAGAAAAFD